MGAPELETKPFWQTSEFWLIVLTNGAAIVAAIGDVLPPQYAVPIMAVVNGMYAIARGLAKQGVSPHVSAPTVVVHPSAPVVVEHGAGSPPSTPEGS